MIKCDRSKIVFCDTETTGLYTWAGHEPWEIAVIYWQERTKHWRHDVFYVQPQHPEKADPFALSICKFWERTKNLNFRWDSPEELIRLARILDGKHLIGAIPWFDVEMLRKMFQDRGMSAPTCHYHLIDIEALALGWIARGVFNPDVNLELPLPWKSEWMFEQLGISKPDDKDVHTALGDAIQVKKVWEKVIGYAATSDP